MQYKYHDEMMQKLHHEACMKILETRNKNLHSEMVYRKKNERETKNKRLL